jgi:hypothetical protein
MAGFDIQGARSDGYSDDDVLNYIRSDRDLSGTFDIDGARKAGYSASDILNEMAAPAAPRGRSMRSSTVCPKVSSASARR